MSAVNENLATATLLPDPKAEKRNKKEKSGYMSRSRKRLIFYICIVGLPVLQFCIFYLWMNINSILLAFKKYDPITGDFSFAAFENFMRVFSGNNGRASVEIAAAIGNSLIVYVISTAVSLTIGLAFSNAIYKKVPGNGVFKVVLFLPQVFSVVVMAILYKYFVQAGLPEIIRILTGNKPNGLLGSDNANVIFYTILFFSVFVSFGNSMLMYTGAMSNISESVKEAGKIDGITPFKEFIHITIPTIYPTMVTFIVVGIAGIFTNQMHLYSFFEGGAETRLSTLGYYLYKMTLKANGLNNPNVEYPYLSAFGLTLTMVAVPLTLFVRWLLEKLGPKTI